MPVQTPFKRIKSQTSKPVGVLMAGGSGTRLLPATQAFNKHLLPIYDKPLIFYSLSILMLAGITEIVLICRPTDQKTFQNLLGTGARFGLTINYVTQSKPLGILDGILAAEKFLVDKKLCVVLGDNFFFGANFFDSISSAILSNRGATIFAYKVLDTSQYGVVTLDNNGKAISLEEKPPLNLGGLAVPGLYIYDETFFDLAVKIKPSERGELEITDLNRSYLNQSNLDVIQVSRGVTWLDCGTPSDFFKASEFVKITEERSGFKIACLEEIAYKKRYLTKSEILKSIVLFENSNYADYIKTVLKLS